MKKCLFILSLFVGIVAYNIYVPMEDEFKLYRDHYVCRDLFGVRFSGFAVGLFFACASFLAIEDAFNYFNRKGLKHE